MNEEVRALMTYRLEQADESFESAQLLCEHKKYRPRFAFALLKVL